MHGTTGERESAKGQLFCRTRPATSPKAMGEPGMTHKQARAMEECRGNESERGADPRSESHWRPGLARPGIPRRPTACLTHSPAFSSLESGSGTWRVLSMDKINDIECHPLDTNFVPFDMSTFSRSLCCMYPLARQRPTRPLCTFPRPDVGSGNPAIKSFASFHKSTCPWTTTVCTLCAYGLKDNDSRQESTRLPGWPPRAG